MPIRIMHVVDTLGKGGLENGLVNLVQQLDPERFEHVVCAIRGLGANQDRLSDRARVLCLGKKSGRLSFQAGDLVRAIRETQPDIVHSRNWAAIEAVGAARWLRTPVVHSEHGIEAAAGARVPWRRSLLRRLAYGMADRVVSVSRQLGDMHAQHTGFSKERITVIHNGVDCQRFRPDATARSEARKQLGFSNDDLCVGTVGNLLPVKDHMTLLEAMNILSADLRRAGRWRLLVIGEGTERPKLEAFVAAHADWKDRVHFLGSSNAIPELLNAMDIFVLPSLFEGISNALLEAMATGLPVVVTAAGGNPEVVSDRQSGLLFRAGDARKLASQLALLGGEKEMREQMGEQALRRAREEFSIDSMVRQYSQLYECVRPQAARKAAAMAGA